MLPGLTTIFRYVFHLTVEGESSSMATRGTSPVRGMLQSHPRKAQIGITPLVDCIDSCFECTQACTACADTCLGEQDVKPMVRCIRLNLDCADACNATGRILLRQTEVDWHLVRRQVEGCAAACQACGRECEIHAAHMEHCRICAASCRRCDEACNKLLALIPA